MNNLAPKAFFVPEVSTTPGLFPLRAIVTDAGQENFTYAWTARTLGSPTIAQTSSTDLLVLERALYTGTIVVELTVSDEDHGISNYRSTLLFGTTDSDAY